jgi:hypothetical protein
MRWKLVFLFGCGMLVLTYASFWETAQASRTNEKLLGVAAVFAAWAIAWVPRMRQAKRQPYTTTDWLNGSNYIIAKGRTHPFDNQRSRWFPLVLAVVSVLILPPPYNGRISLFAQRVLALIIVATIGLVELFRKPRTEQSAPNSP